MEGVAIVVRGQVIETSEYKDKAGEVQHRVDVGWFGGKHSVACSRADAEKVKSGDKVVFECETRYFFKKGGGQEMAIGAGRLVEVNGKAVSK